MLTERQSNEMEYHRKRAEGLRDRLLSNPIGYGSVSPDAQRRRWNATWEMYRFLRNQDLAEKRVLVVGCGYGQDALRIEKLGARVYPFDLSPESTEIAYRLGEREKSGLVFQIMAAEELAFRDDTFDAVVAVDILHHVDIPRTMEEILRVSKKNALFVLNEVYTHSAVESVRRSSLVDRFVYRPLQRHLYHGETPYITEDERKLSEKDIKKILAGMQDIQMQEYFNFVVGRLIPKAGFNDKVDKFAIDLLRFFGLSPQYLGGRVLIGGHIKK